jgi:hypothetical protein
VGSASEYSEINRKDTYKYLNWRFYLGEHYGGHFEVITGYLCILRRYIRLFEDISAPPVSGKM